MALVTPPPVGLRLSAAPGNAENVVGTANVVVRIRRTNAKVVTGVEEALALVAPSPTGLAGARARDNIVATAGVVVGA